MCCQPKVLQLAHRNDDCGVEVLTLRFVSDSSKVSGKVLVEGSSSTKLMLKRRAKRNRPKTRAETKLTSFQYDVLLFLSSLPTETVLSVVEKKEDGQGTFIKPSEIREQRLIYQMPFTDMKVPLFLGKCIFL